MGPHHSPHAHVLPTAPRPYPQRFFLLSPSLFFSPAALFFSPHASILTTGGCAPFSVRTSPSFFLLEPTMGVLHLLPPPKNTASKSFHVVNQAAEICWNRQWRLGVLGSTTPARRPVVLGRHAWLMEPGRRVLEPVFSDAGTGVRPCYHSLQPATAKSCNRRHPVLQPSSVEATTSHGGATSPHD